MADLRNSLLRTRTMTRQAKPEVKMGKSTVILFNQKKPLTFKERYAQAKKAQEKAKRRADDLNRKAAEAEKSGDSKQAARYITLANKAVEKLGSANAKVETMYQATKKKAEHLGAEMAENANKIASMRKGAEGSTGKQKEWYEKEAAKAEAKAAKLDQKTKKFEADYSGLAEENTGAMVKGAAEGFAKDIVKKQTELYNEDPRGNEAPHKIEELNASMGLPPGGMAEVEKKAAAESEQKATAAAAQPKPNTGAPSESMPTTPTAKASPTAPEAPKPAVASKDGGGPARDRSKPRLQRGDQGGWYYETKGGARVYVQK